MPGSGKPIPKGADVTQKTTTNDQGQKVTRTTVKTSGSSTDGFAGQPDKKAQLIDVKNRRREIQGLPPLTGGTNSGSSSSSKTIGVDQSAGKSDTKSLVNPNKKQNVKNAKNLKKDFTKVDKQTSSMSIDKEPAAQVDVGKFSGPGGF